MGKGQGWLVLYSFPGKDRGVGPSRAERLLAPWSDGAARKTPHAGAAVRARLPKATCPRGA